MEILSLSAVLHAVHLTATCQRNRIISSSVLFLTIFHFSQDHAPGQKIKSFT